MAVPPPPPDLGGNAFIFGADPSKKRRQLFPGKSQSGTSPHSKAQGLSDTASFAAPAATLPSLETGQKHYPKKCHMLDPWDLIQ